MDKRIFISEEEKEKCQRVADAYSELYDIYGRACCQCG